ncbi:MAG: YraN family protein [Candidatus Gastranaerophilales bacterium]|nr:YraN family protein [Candidatus Gastranaerophilales bacterium]
MFVITNQTVQTGKKGEDIAAQYLQKSGYTILERNKHFSKNCEIDIIAKDKDTTVFVEVKTRKSLNFGHPFEAINNAKMQKIFHGVLLYCAENKISKYRIDGIAVIGTVSPQIEHLKNLSLN